MTRDLGPTLYGVSNGNGPLHLLPDGRESRRTLCGRTRFSVHGFSGADVCRECERVQRASDRPTSAAIGQVAESLRQFKAAREGMAAQLAQLRGSPGVEAGRVLVEANDAGFSGTELAAILGVSRQAMSARLSYMRRRTDEQP